MHRADFPDLFDQGRRFIGPLVPMSIDDALLMNCVILSRDPDLEDIQRIMTDVRSASPPLSRGICLPSPEMVLATYRKALEWWREELSQFRGQALRFWRAACYGTPGILDLFPGEFPEVADTTIFWASLSAFQWNDRMKLTLIGNHAKDPQDAAEKLALTFYLSLAHCCHMHYFFDPAGRPNYSRALALLKLAMDENITVSEHGHGLIAKLAIEAGPLVPPKNEIEANDYEKG